MARPLRISYEGAVYHVTARGNERKNIVIDDDDRRRFVKVLLDVVDQFEVILYAWVLMDNHYHLLLETPKANLSLAIRHLNGVYTQGFNRYHKRAGHLFQGRFKSILVEKEAYLLELCRYVVLNPVRAAMASHPREWLWGSYRTTSGEEECPKWLEADWLLSQLGRGREQSRESYRKFVEAGIDRDESPWSDLKSQIYLGGEDFLEGAKKYIEKMKDAREIPEIQRRPTVLRWEELLGQVGKHYGLEPGELVRFTRRPSEARRVAIYLSRRILGLKLNEISDKFGMGYTGVSRCVSAVKKKAEEDVKFRKKLERIVSDSKVKT
jgi:REP element-mobilizing transposase RayT